MSTTMFNHIANYYYLFKEASVHNGCCATLHGNQKGKIKPLAIHHSRKAISVIVLKTRSDRLVGPA